jgi:hypothetical protein
VIPVANAQPPSKQLPSQQSASVPHWPPARLWFGPQHSPSSQLPLQQPPAQTEPAARQQLPFSQTSFTQQSPSPLQLPPGWAQQPLGPQVPAQHSLPASQVAPFGVQIATQAPPTHESPAPQAFPQTPQFCGSLWVLAQKAPEALVQAL